MCGWDAGAGYGCNGTIRRGNTPAYSAGRAALLAVSWPGAGVDMAGRAAGAGAGCHLARQSRHRGLQNGANWGPGTVPTGTAFFGASDTTALSVLADTTVGGLTFNAGASAYSFTNSQNLNFDGAGIVVNGGSATVINDYWLIFTNASLAGSATMINNSFQYFVDTSTAGSATITSSGNLSFYVGSTAGSAAITNTTWYLRSSRQHGRQCHHHQRQRHDCPRHGRQRDDYQQLRLSSSLPAQPATPTSPTTAPWTLSGFATPRAAALPSPTTTS